MTSQPMDINYITVIASLKNNLLFLLKIQAMYSVPEQNPSVEADVYSLNLPTR